MDFVKEILKLKEEKGALILAHLYQRPEIQEIADIVGDSYYLSKKAVESDSNLIVFCGVKFMAESAKILSPNKKVLLPANESTCPMADMGLVERVEDLKKQHPDAYVVSYINTNIDIKSISDVCVTSSSALKIMKNIKQKEIIFVPDRNLGSFIAEKFPEKDFILYQGFCPTHERITKEDILPIMEEHPEYEVLAHPECNIEVRSIAHFVGSTSEIIDYSAASDKEGFIVVTEEGVLHPMKKKSPNKVFLTPKTKMICPNMKMTHLEDVYRCLRDEDGEIILNEEQRLKALSALEKMHLLGDD